MHALLWLPFELEALLKEALVRRMLAEDGGVGSAVVYSSHKVLPYFGPRGNGMPLSCMDHAAPIFA